MSRYPNRLQIYSQLDQCQGGTHMWVCWERLWNNETVGSISLAVFQKSLLLPKLLLIILFAIASNNTELRGSWWCTKHHALITVVEWVVRVDIVRPILPSPISLELGGVRNLDDPRRITLCWVGISWRTLFCSSRVSSDTWGSMVSDELWASGWPDPVWAQDVLLPPSFSSFPVGAACLSSRENLGRYKWAD